MQSHHIYIWLTASEWHYTFCKSTGSITSFPTINRKWVRLQAVSSHIFSNGNREWVILHILLKTVSSHLFLPKVCGWHCTFCEQQSHHFFPMANRKWMTFHMLWKAVSLYLLISHDWQQVSDILHFVKDIVFNDQQQVSDIAFFVKGSLITSSAMTNSKWVMFHIFRKIVSSHFCYYDKQKVRDVAYFMRSNLMTSFPMNNRRWVTLHILCMAVSWHLFLWPTGSEWHYKVCEMQCCHHIYFYDQQEVSSIAHVMNCISHHDQQAVSDTAHFVKAVASYLFLWPTGGEWHCKLCEG